MLRIGDKIIFDRTFNGHKFIDTFELIFIDTLLDFTCDVCGRRYPEKKFMFKSINSDDILYIGTTCIKKVKDNRITYSINTDKNKRQLND